MHDIVGEITKYFISGYRKTTGQQDWVMDPTDPRQFETEVIPYAIAQYRAAAEAYQLNTDSVSFTPVDVHNMMLKRAEEFALAKLVLQEIRYNEIYFIFRDAERCNSPDLFFVGVRLALPLFSATNARNYVRLCIELLIWVETASPAERALFEEFAFTRITTDGKCQYVDLAQEKVNQYFRDIVGHNVIPGHARRMVNAAVGLQEFLQKNQELKAIHRPHIRSSGDFNSRMQNLDAKLYSNVRVRIEALKLWDEHNPLMIGVGEDLEPAQPNYLQSPEGDYLPSICLRDRTIGSQRSFDYFDAFYVEQRYPKTRSRSAKNGGIMLDKLPSTADEFRKTRTKRVALSTAMSKREIVDASGNRKEPILTEISAMRDKLTLEDRSNLHVNLDQLSPSFTVSQLAEILVKCRKQWIKSMQSTNEDIGAILAQAAENTSKIDAFSDPQFRRKELQHDFFQLDSLEMLKFQEPLQLLR
jgi:hypothetical protein